MPVKWHQVICGALLVPGILPGKMHGTKVNLVLESIDGMIQSCSCAKYIAVSANSIEMAVNQNHQGIVSLKPYLYFH